MPRRHPPESSADAMPEMPRQGRHGNVRVNRNSNRTTQCSCAAGLTTRTRRTGSTHAWCVVARATPTCSSPSAAPAKVIALAVALAVVLTHLACCLCRRGWSGHVRAVCSRQHALQEQLLPLPRRRLACKHQLHLQCDRCDTTLVVLSINSCWLSVTQVSQQMGGMQISSQMPSGQLVNSPLHPHTLQLNGGQHSQQPDSNLIVCRHLCSPVGYRVGCVTPVRRA
jgi:hypothetical protein